MPAGIILAQRDRINNTYSLHVGIDKYPFAGVFKSLKGCVRDAKDMFSTFNTNESKLLLDEKATRKNILGHIEWYTKNLRNRDLLIITISAHGTIVNNDLAIVTYDVEDDNLLGTVLPMSYTVNAISEIAKNGGKVLLILDACHTGAINFDIAKYSGLVSQGGISCMNSCGPREYAYEYQFSEDVGRQGAFTKHIIDGLSGKADFDNLGIITLRNLYDYAYEKVHNQFSRQHPLLIGTLEGNTILKVF
jgi:uncharacterized caspase-like protein